MELGPVDPVAPITEQVGCSSSGIRFYAGVGSR